MEVSSDVELMETPVPWVGGVHRGGMETAPAPGATGGDLAGSRRTVSDLAALLDAPDPLARMAAARALGGLGASAAAVLDALDARLSDDNDGVQEEVAGAIVRITVLSADVLSSVDERLDRAFAAFERMLEGPRWFRRWETIRSLGSLARALRPARAAALESLAAGSAPIRRAGVRILEAWASAATRALVTLYRIAEDPLAGPSGVDEVLARWESVVRSTQATLRCSPGAVRMLRPEFIHELFQLADAFGRAARQVGTVP